MKSHSPGVEDAEPQFFTAEKGLRRHFKADARRMGFGGGGRPAIAAWQRKARRHYAELLGLHRFTRCNPSPHRRGATAVDDFIREEWSIQTEPDVWMPFTIFVPRDVAARGPLPLALCPHGHASGGKWAPAGRRDIPGIDRVIEVFNYDYGLQLARAGFVTVCPDARGFGERREPEQQEGGDEPVLRSSCHNLTMAGAPLGMTVRGMWAWDLMRLIDHLLTDPRIDSKRIACAGLSGGGLQTLDLAALDTRVGAAVVSGYYYGVRESLQVLNGNCMCNLVPNMWLDFDLGDIGALVAPRPLFVEAGDADPLNGASGLGNVRSQLRISRRAFEAYDAVSSQQHHFFKGGHRWDGTRSVPWLARQMKAGLMKRIRELMSTGRPLKWLFVGDSITHGALHTYGARDYTQLFAERITFELGRYSDMVITTARSGWTTGEVLAQFGWAVEQWKADVILIMLGMNDCSAGRNTTPQAFRTELTELVERTQSAGSGQVVLQTTCTVLGDAVERAPRLPAFMQEIRDIATTMNLALVDHTLAWTERCATNPGLQYAWLDDPIHPGIYGHRFMAETLFRELNIYDEEAKSCRLFYPG